MNERVQIDMESLDFSKGSGLVAVVAQDARTGVVLMVAHADREALERTIATGEMHYRSRARGLWHKGESSGNVQRVVSLSIDCDRDAVLARIIPAGPACHTGSMSCFGDLALNSTPLAALDVTIRDRSQTTHSEPSQSPSYTRRLLRDRNLRMKKIGEEAAELLVALSDGDAKRATDEGADLLYHVLVGLRAAGVSLDDLQAALAGRTAG
jgi:phosphoribosyl-ATP pyrophosphohydrolase/phosphoribosyl-AMP cyclohydrolase